MIEFVRKMIPGTIEDYDMIYEKRDWQESRPFWAKCKKFF